MQPRHGVSTTAATVLSYGGASPPSPSPSACLTLVHLHTYDRVRGGQFVHSLLTQNFRK